eukprot:2059325-Amphidinium_carterae.1
MGKQFSFKLGVFLFGGRLSCLVSCLELAGAPATSSPTSCNVVHDVTCVRTLVNCRSSAGWLLSAHLSDLLAGPWLPSSLRSMLTTRTSDHCYDVVWDTLCTSASKLELAGIGAEPWCLGCQHPNLTWFSAGQRQWRERNWICSRRGLCHAQKEEGGGPNGPLPSEFLLPSFAREQPACKGFPGTGPASRTTRWDKRTEEAKLARFKFLAAPAILACKREVSCKRTLYHSPWIGVLQPDSIHQCCSYTPKVQAHRTFFLWAHWSFSSGLTGAPHSDLNCWSLSPKVATVGLEPTMCRARGEVPMGEGALDETFDLAFKTDARNVSQQHQAGVFLDCSKCYERAPLAQLEQFAIEPQFECGLPLYALNCALNMYSGSRWILVSESVKSTCGLPPGCGLAVDLLHAFLIRTLQSAGRQVEVRKYVDDMVLVASGPYFAHYLRDMWTYSPNGN